VSGYRVFLLKSPAGFLASEEFDAASDEAAIAMARDLAQAYPYASGYELWERARLVCYEGEAFRERGCR
jgi:hypothetical protein